MRPGWPSATCLMGCPAYLQAAMAYLTKSHGPIVTNETPHAVTIRLELGRVAGPTAFRQT
jgi:hypothetical protein